MPEWLFWSYLVLSFVSLQVAIHWMQWRRLGRASPPIRALGALGSSLGGALLLTVPLFYLIYIGILVPYRQPVAIAISLAIPLLWAHLAVFSWSRGTGRWQDGAVGITLSLTIPVLYVVAYSGAFLRLPVILPICNWALFLTGLWLWRRPQRGGGPKVN